MNLKLLYWVLLMLASIASIYFRLDSIPHEVSIIGVILLFGILFVWGSLVGWLPWIRHHEEENTLKNIILGILERLALVCIVVNLPISFQVLIVLPVIFLYKKYHNVIRPGYFLTGEYAISLFFGLPTLIVFDAILITIFFIQKRVIKR